MNIHALIKAALYGMPIGAAAYLLSILLQQLATQRREGTEITWADQCGKTIERIPTEHKWVYILLAMLLMTASALYTHSSYTRAFIMLELSILLAVSIMDLKYRIIPNGFCFLIMIVKLASMFTPYLVYLTPSVWPNLANSGIGLGMCFLVFFGGGILTGGKVGMGDVKLAMAVGFLLGWKDTLVAIALMGVLMMPFVFTMQGITLKNRFKQFVPMGPPLSLAAILVLIAGYSPLVQYMRF